jgi:hypothetical protein
MTDIHCLGPKYVFTSFFLVLSTNDKLSFFLQDTTTLTMLTTASHCLQMDTFLWLWMQGPPWPTLHAMTYYLVWCHGDTAVSNCSWGESLPQSDLYSSPNNGDNLVLSSLSFPTPAIPSQQQWQLLVVIFIFACLLTDPYHWPNDDDNLLSSSSSFLAGPHYNLSGPASVLKGAHHCRSSQMQELKDVTGDGRNGRYRYRLLVFTHGLPCRSLGLVAWGRCRGCGSARQKDWYQALSLSSMKLHSPEWVWVMGLLFWAWSPWSGQKIAKKMSWPVIQPHQPC